MFHPEHRDYLIVMEMPHEAKRNQRATVLRGKSGSLHQVILKHKGYPLIIPKCLKNFHSFKKHRTPFIYQVLRDSVARKTQNLLKELSLVLQTNGIRRPHHGVTG